MLFKKSSVILALLAFTSVTAEDLHLRNRELTVCPAEPVALTCTILQSGDGSGTKGTFSTVATVSAPGSLALDSFDPNGCYNILCETSDTIASKRLNWAGSFTGGSKVSSKTPYYISGASSGAGCTKLASSCDGLGITIQAARAPAPGVTDLSPYICSELTITCKAQCYQCPGDLVPLKTCPASKSDCACPSEEVPVGNDMCEPCKTGFYFKNGVCVPSCFTCPGELVPLTGCPAALSDCACPNQEVNVGDYKCEPCKTGYNYEHGQCVSVCGAGKKLDPSGYCVHDWCTTDFHCPANSERIAGRECYNDCDDCKCKYGYYQFLNYCKPYFWCWWH